MEEIKDEIAEEVAIEEPEFVEVVGDCEEVINEIEPENVEEE